MTMLLSSKQYNDRFNNDILGKSSQSFSPFAHSQKFNVPSH